MDDYISRQEMLRTYQELCMDIACSECSFYFGDALTGDCLFEKWIHSLPSAEKIQLSEEDATKDATSDLIRRVEATTIPVMPKEHREYQTMNLDDAYEQGWFDCQKCIEELPSAEQERKKGKWIKEYWNGEYTRKCSACNITQTVTTHKGKVDFNYCPYCGADMRGNNDA